MKKFFSIALLTLALSTYAQFPGRHPELLLNKEVQVTDLSPRLQTFGYRDFHKKEEIKVTDKAIKYSDLVGKTFRVTDVKPYDKNGESNFILKLESSENGIMYYNYSPAFEDIYRLSVIGGLTLPEEVYCSDLKSETDKFTSQVKTTVPYTEGVSFIKVEKDGKSTIYLIINQIGSTLKLGDGFILLLENGKRIENASEKIDVKVNSGYTGATGYVYSAFVALSENDIKLLSENSITDKRLYIYDGVVKNGNKIKEYLKCLVK
jgi:hypothetical protein